MKRKINNVEIFYEEFGLGKSSIVLLHGWGQSHAFWTKIFSKFSRNFHVYVLDLPGFGMSQEPPIAWDHEDYADFIHAFVLYLDIKNPVIMGHSFGGRIATVYDTKYPLGKLILYSNGGLPQRSIKTLIFKYVINQWGKYLCPNQLYKLHTSLFKPKQYKNIIIVEKERSRRILDIYTRPFPNLKKYFAKITIPTLIIIGEKDYLISPKIGKKIHILIKNSLSVEFLNASHFAHIEEPEIFYQKVIEFLSK